MKERATGAQARQAQPCLVDAPARRLPWRAVRQYQYGRSAWPVPLFVAASIVPVIAVVRHRSNAA